MKPQVNFLQVDKDETFLSTDTVVSDGCGYTYLQHPKYQGYKIVATLKKEVQDKFDFCMKIKTKRLLT